MPYRILPATPAHTRRIVEIYNSHPAFLRHHLGVTAVDEAFIAYEQASMQAADFLSCVIMDEQNIVVGVLDYKPDTTVYLSLLMLDAKRQGRGVGSGVYALFEKQMARQHRQTIRIDVVDDYPDHVVPFWGKQGFTPTDRTPLTWGHKTSQAVVMIKRL